MMTRDVEIRRFIATALGSSIDLSPLDPGLSLDELCTIGEQLGFGRGELQDELYQRDYGQAHSGRRYLLPVSDASFVAATGDPRPWRRVEGFDFVKTQFLEVARQKGKAFARVPLETLLTRATAAGVATNDAETAVGWFLASRDLVLEGDMLTAKPSFVANDWLASRTLEHNRSHGSHREGPEQDVYSSRVHQLVEDLIERRTDGRPSRANPLDAFADVLADLGYPGYVVWWRQTVREWKYLDPQAAPISRLVLSAALGEAALSFVARRAHGSGLTMGKLDTARTDRKWQFRELIRTAKQGARPILDGDLGGRCERLNERRQRIHVGRFLSVDATASELDLRPEEVSEASETVRRLVRAVLDWLGAEDGPEEGVGS